MGRVLLLLLLLGPGVCPAASTPPDTSGFALVLGGGGARGLAHVGVLKVLEEEGLRPSLVVGTSMGAVIGALYACGLDAGRLEALVADLPWTRYWSHGRLPVAEVQGGWPDLPETPLALLLDRWPPLLPPGLASPLPMETALGRFTAEALLEAGGEFDRLPVPFRCVATDLVSGEAVVLERGPLARAVRASATIPLLFPPVEWEGRLLVDGGFRRVNPVEVARRAGFRRILVVDVSNVFLPAEDLPGDLYRMWIRTAELNMLESAQVDVGPQEVLLRPDLRPWRSLSFGAAAAILAEGYATADARRDELRRLGEGGRPRPAAPDPRLRRLETVEVEGADWLGAQRVRARLGVETGARLTAGEIWKRVEGAGRFTDTEELWLRLEAPASDRLRVRVQVRERRVPRLELAGHVRSDEGAGVRARLHQPLLPGGAALALDGWVGGRGGGGALRLRRPVGAAGWALILDGEAEREVLPLYAGGREVDRAVLERRGGALRLEWGHPAVALRLGGGAGAADAYPESRRFPGTGERALRAVVAEVLAPGPVGPARRAEEGFVLRWMRAVPRVGGELDFWRVEAGLAAGLHADGARWRPRVALGGAAASIDLPPAWMPRAGGPRGWAGLRQDEILAPRLAWGRVALARDLVLGLELEAALAVGWSGRESLDEAAPLWGGALTASLRTPLGPARSGWALAEQRRGRIFVLLGPEF